jgi:hypothetical protein
MTTEVVDGFKLVMTGGDEGNKIKVRIKFVDFEKIYEYWNDKVCKKPVEDSCGDDGEFLDHSYYDYSECKSYGLRSCFNVVFYNLKDAEKFKYASGIRYKATNLSDTKHREYAMPYMAEKFGPDECKNRAFRWDRKLVVDYCVEREWNRRFLSKKKFDFLKNNLGVRPKADVKYELKDIDQSGVQPARSPKIEVEYVCPMSHKNVAAMHKEVLEHAFGQQLTDMKWKFENYAQWGETVEAVMNFDELDSSLLSKLISSFSEKSLTV